jgi:hypothetical protein
VDLEEAKAVRMDMVKGRMQFVNSKDIDDKGGLYEL